MGLAGFFGNKMQKNIRFYLQYVKNMGIMNLVFW